MRALIRDATEYAAVNIRKLFASGIMLLSGEIVDNEDIIHIADDLRLSRAKCNRCGRITAFDDKCSSCGTRRYFSLFNNDEQFCDSPVMGLSLKFGTKAALIKAFNNNDSRVSDELIKEHILDH